MSLAGSDEDDDAPAAAAVERRQQGKPAGKKKARPAPGEFSGGSDSEGSVGRGGGGFVSAGESDPGTEASPAVKGAGRGRKRAAEGSGAANRRREAAAAASGPCGRCSLAESMRTSCQ